MAAALIGLDGFVARNLMAQAQLEPPREGVEYDLAVSVGAPDVPVSAKKLVVISSFAAYARPEDVDEDSPAKDLGDFTLVRLPVAFGPGLASGPLYDLLADRVEDLHPDSVFQYYAIAHLWRDVLMALDRGLAVLNLASEPLPTRELALRCLGRELTSYPHARPVTWDVRSKHAPLWGGEKYLYSKERVLKEISDFIEKERAL